MSLHCLFSIVPGKIDDAKISKCTFPWSASSTIDHYIILNVIGQWSWLVSVMSVLQYTVVYQTNSEQIRSDLFCPFGRVSGSCEVSEVM